MRRDENPRLSTSWNQAVAAGDWPAIWSAARQLAPDRRDDLRFLNLAARAAQVMTDRGGDHLGQAIVWLTRALELAPGDVETLHQLGAIAARRGLLPTAADYWSRAWTADPDNPTVRASLLQLFRRQGTIPDWGLPLAEQELLAGRGEPDLLGLLLAAYAHQPELPAAAERLLRERVPAGERDEVIDRLARARFRRGDFATAAALLAQLDSPTARRRQAVAEARAALARGEPPPATDEPGPTGDLIRAARGDSVPASRLAAALPAEFAPVAAWLRGEPAGEFADSVAGRWLASALAHAQGDAAAVSGDEPELRLWRRYLAARAADDPSALLPLARRAEPPWSALRELALEQAARTAPLPALAKLEDDWTPAAQRIAALRRAAAALSAGEQPDWDTLPAELVTRLLQRALEVRLAAEPTQQVGEPFQPTERWWWLMAWRARQAGETAAVAAAVEQLEPETTFQPEVALLLADWLPEQAERLLSAALRRQRDHLGLRRALARQAARTGDIERFRGWAAGLPESDQVAIAAVDDLLVQPLAELPAREGEPAVVRLAAAAALALDHPEAALRRLGAADDAEARNLRAWLLWRLGEPAAAAAELTTIPGESPAVAHNLGLLAEAAGDLAAAARCREQALAGGRPEPAVRYASHRRLARLHGELGDRERALRHWQVCLSLREDTLEPLRATRTALLELGRAEESLVLSESLLAKADELQDRLDHVAVLAAARGAAAAAAFLDRLAAERPAAAEAVAARRQELYHQLEKALRERWGTQDYLGLFSAARDAELAAPTARDRAAALLHQVIALGNLAKSGDGAARLEQAYRKAGEVIALEVPERLRAQAEKLRGQVGERLAPQLLRQAEDLFRHRANQFQELRREPAPDPRRYGQFGEAFERVIELLERVAELGGERYAAPVGEGLRGARELAEQARRRAAGET